MQSLKTSLRSTFLFFSLGAILMLGSACQGKIEAPSDTFRLAWEADARSIDPRYTVDANSYYLSDLLGCSLINFGPNGEIISELATQRTWKSPTELEMKLDPGARFWDGTKVTANDVKATYDFFSRNDVADPSPLKGAFEKIASIEVPSEDTVIFRLKEADAAFVSNLVIAVMPAELARGERIQDIAKLTGCGDYKIASRDAQKTRLERVRPNSGDAKFVEIYIVKDEGTRFLKLRNNEIDFVQNELSLDQVKNIENYKNLQVLKRPGLRTTYLAFHFKDPMLKKAAVREAIALAIDRKKIVEHIFHGWATLAKNILPPTDEFSNPNVEQVPFDPSKARSILDAAGVSDPDGEGPKSRMELELRTTTNPTRELIAKSIATDLGEIGIKVKVQTLEWGKFKEDVENGVAQMWNLGWVGFKDPDIYRYAFATESAPPNGGNRGLYANASLDKALSASQKEVDIEKRKQLIHKIEEILAKDKPYVFLWHEDTFAVMNNRVSNFRIFADGRLSDLSKVKLAATTKESK